MFLFQEDAQVVTQARLLLIGEEPIVADVSIKKGEPLLREWLPQEFSPLTLSQPLGEHRCTSRNGSVLTNGGINQCDDMFPPLPFLSSPF